MIGCGYFGSLKRADYAIAAACRQPLAWSYGCPTAAAQERRRSKNNPRQHRPSYLGHEGQDPSFRGQPLNQRQVTTFVEVYCRDARVEKESLLPVKFSTLRQGRIEEFIRRCSDHLGAFEVPPSRKRSGGEAQALPSGARSDKFQALQATCRQVTGK
jgi:hypothetical protein